MVALEARQQGVLAARLGAMPSVGAQVEGSAGGRQVRRRVVIAATGPLFAADWVEVGSAARVHPLERAELAGGAVGVARLGRLDDSTDPLEARQGPPQRCDPCGVRHTRACDWPACTDRLGSLVGLY